MKLYHSPTSPYVRKVMVLLHETGQFDHVELVPAATSPVAQGTMPYAQNPLGKVPTLEREDGPALYDSRVITRYLDHRAGGVLYPGPAAALGHAGARGDRRRHSRCGAPDGLREQDPRRGPAQRGAGSRASGARSPAHSTPSRTAGCRICTARSTWARSRWPAPWAISTCATMRGPGAAAATASPPGPRRSPSDPRCRPPFPRARS